MNFTIWLETVTCHRGGGGEVEEARTLVGWVSCEGLDPEWLGRLG